EGQGDDGDVVAPQAQRRQADDDPGQAADEGRAHENEQEVQVDAALGGGDPGDTDVNVGLEEEVRAEPAQGVCAEGVEGDVTEVEQAGEAHHHVETQRHDREGHGDDGGVHEAA